MGPDQQQIFDECFRRRGLGGLLELEGELALFGTEVSHIKTRSLAPLNRVFTEISKPRSAHDPHASSRRQVYADFYLSTDFNGVATQADGYPLDFIGISFTVLPCINTLTAFIARHYASLEPIPREICERIRVTRWFDFDSVISCQNDLASAGWFDYRSTDQTSIRNALAGGIVDCMLMHELGHILMGHVGFCREEFGISVVSESQEYSGLTRDLKYVMEIEADRFILDAIRSAGDDLDVIVILVRHLPRF